MMSNREKAAFESFVRSSSDQLLRTAYLLCGDPGHAEDLVQATLLRTARRWHTARRQPHAYARRVLVNLVKDRWRAQARRPVEDPLPATVDFPSEGNDADRLIDRRDLMQAIAMLSDGQRAVLVLRYFDDLSVDDTAAALSCTAGTVKSQTSRALAALRAVLDPIPDLVKETTDVYR